MKRILVLFILAAGVISGCKEKKSTPEPTVKKVEVEKEPQPVVEEIVEPEAAIDEGVNVDDKYFIIVNSYAVADFAFEKLNHFKQEGFKPKLLMRNDNGYYCLALKSFDEYSTAEKAAEDLRLQNDEFSGAWILDRSNQKIEDKKE